MPKIQVITEELLGKSKTIAQGAADILNSQNSVTKTVQNLGKDFSGRMPALITSNILAMRDKNRAMNDALNDYGKFLEHTANTYEWNDREMAKWASALGGDRGASVGAVAGGTTPPSGTTGTGHPGLAAQDTNSNFYNMSLNASKYIGEGPRKGRLNCVYYARARAMEVNQMNTWAQGTPSDTIQSNSIANFPGHDVYIESVYTDANGVQRVAFSESNWGDNAADPRHDDMPLSDFFSRRGAPNGYMQY